MSKPMLAALALLAIFALMRSRAPERPVSPARRTSQAPPMEPPAPGDVDIPPRPLPVVPPAVAKPREPRRARLDPPPFTGGPYAWRKELALSPEQEDAIWDLWMTRQAELDMLSPLPDDDNRRAFVAEIEDRYEWWVEALLDPVQAKEYQRLIFEHRLGIPRLDAIRHFQTGEEPPSPKRRSISWSSPR